MNNNPIITHFTEYPSPVGKLTLTSDGTNITGLYISGQKHIPHELSESHTVSHNLDVFIKAKDWLNCYFAGKKPRADELPLLPSGTAFRRLIWKYLCEIPYGEVVTYGELARRTSHSLGKEKMSAQAIGGAVGHNPISIIIPCHRVVGVGGNLTGYDGGIDIKIKLLSHEGVNMEKFFTPQKRQQL